MQPADTASSPLLDVRDLCTEFRGEDAVVRAVDGVSFAIRRGEVLGMVGESGCGKSATSLSILRLLPEPHGRIASGEVIFDGRDLTKLGEAEMRRIRGRHIAMIFQDPMTSLNPYLRVGEQLAETTIFHLGLSKKQAFERSVEFLARVGIPDPEQRARSYPHELSGGMRQRVMIAMALLCNPDLLMADEPTTALDVTIQAQILELLLELRRDHGLSILLITHDLGVVASTCDRVLVMYAGRIVESAPAQALFERPLHPYTLALMKSVPRVDAKVSGRLDTIEGLPPRLDLGPFRECAFAARCPFVHDACRRSEPALVEAAPDRRRRCVLPVEHLP